MFTVATLAETIAIKPEDFSKRSRDAIKDNINALCANRVCPGVGLCISVINLIHCSEGLIGHRTGLVHVHVVFDMLVFRPFRSEILEGTIKHCDEHGITLDMDFTCEVFIPEENLFEGSEFDVAENTWVWKTDTELFFDRGEICRFRVEQEIWEEGTKADEVDEVEELKSTFRIVGSMAQAGLGPKLWWQEEAVEELEEGDKGEAMEK